MLTVKVRRNEPTERAISKLKNLIVKEGTLQQLKEKRYYKKPSLRKKLKREGAARQRTKDFHKEVRAAQRIDEVFLK